MLGRTGFLILFVFFYCPYSPAESYHTVGWFNTLVPGGGKALMGDWKNAGLQFGLEVSTFSLGYSMSAKSPFTLDGVPENIPDPHAGVFGVTTKKVCTKFNSRGQCLNYKTTTSSGASSYDNSVTDITPALQADVLQEIGLKAHMVNVFDAYRMSAKSEDIGQGIDQSPLQDLFLAPFSMENLTDKYVYLPLLVSLAFHTYTYLNEKRVTGAPLNADSNTQYGLVYGAVYPIGSGAPEEMFYRGFMQNEFYQWTGSPYWAVPMSTLAYTLSHSPDSWLSAGVSGLYLGALAYKEKGQLKKNITFHFWSDVFLGIHAILTLARNEHTPPNQSDASVSAIRMTWEY